MLPIILLALYVFPNVLNIGLGLRIKRRLLLTCLLATAAAFALAAYLMDGHVLSFPLSGLLRLFLMYTYGH